MCHDTGINYCDGGNHLQNDYNFQTYHINTLYTSNFTPCDMSMIFQLIWKKTIMVQVDALPRLASGNFQTRELHNTDIYTEISRWSNAINNNFSNMLWTNNIFLWAKARLTVASFKPLFEYL